MCVRVYTPSAYTHTHAMYAAHARVLARPASIHTRPYKVVCVWPDVRPLPPPPLLYAHTQHNVRVFDDTWIHTLLKMRSLPESNVKATSGVNQGTYFFSRASCIFASYALL